MSKILYSIQRSAMDNNLLVYVTPKDHWEENGYQSDVTPQEAIDEIRNAGFPASEIMEGVIEISNKDGSVPASEETEAGLVEYMLECDLFEYNDAFANFCQECDEEMI